MQRNNGSSDFFRAGGTLHLSAPSYVKRPVDEELFRLTKAGRFCYVLTPRQMGKSSLMIRTADRLRTEDARTAIVDLSALGTQITAEQWYLGIVRRLVAELQLSLSPEQWWQDHSALSVVQRFTDFLRDVVLAKVPGKVVVFMDEIDSTLRLAFTDDFFAAIRVMYNLRASDHEYERLTFVLLGVASPTDLITDRRRTPFNIGQAVDLSEFTRQDANPLEDGLEHLFPGNGRRVLNRIFYWTNGHPYLTQRLCLEISQYPDLQWDDEAIDQAVVRLFLSEAEGKDDNLQFVRSNIDASPDRRQLLLLYRRVYQGHQVLEDKRSAVHNRLKLIGLVESRNGVLQVRNEIYRRAFDLTWIKENTPAEWTRYVTVVAIVVSVLAVGLVFLVFRQQKIARIKGLTQTFHTFNSPAARQDLLLDLCGESPNDAAILFTSLSQREKLAMFPPPPGRYAEPYNAAIVAHVVDCLRPALCREPPVSVSDEELLAVICHALPGPHHRDHQGHECICGDEED